MKNLWFSALKRLGASACIFLAAFVGMAGNAHALSCPYGKVEQAGLCYSPPRDGYSCTGALCLENCRSGYSPSVPGFCHYQGALTYTEGPYIDRRSNHPHKCGLLFYANCRSNYNMDVCGICSYKGAWDITRNSYYRAPGISPDFSNAFNLVSSTVQATYGSATGQIQAAYQLAITEIQKFYDAVLARIFRAAGKALMAQNDLGAALGETIKAFNTLKADPNTLNDMKRVLAIVASNKQLLPGSNELNDVNTVMKKIAADLESKISASNSAALKRLDNSSWGIFTSAGAAYGVGAQSGFALIMNRKLDSNGKVQYAVLNTTGGSLGVAVIAGADIGYMWNPGPVSEQDGAFVGLVGAGDVGVGVSGSLSWSVSKGMRGAELAIPSISAGAGVGAGAQLSLAGGNSWILQRFSF